MEYATKYATKAEKGSKAMEAVFAHTLERARKAHGDEAPVLHAYASFLVGLVGGRDWSAQEVGHVAMGHPTTVLA